MSKYEGNSRGAGASSNRGIGAAVLEWHRRRHYVGHSETFRRGEAGPAVRSRAAPAADAGRRESGPGTGRRGRCGVWHVRRWRVPGQSVPRLAFLKQVMDDSPPRNRTDRQVQERRMGGKAGNITSCISARKTPRPAFRPLQDQPHDGMKFTAEVIDTWNMTITRGRRV